MDQKERPIELLFPVYVNRCIFYWMIRIGESPARLDIQLFKSIHGHDRYQWQED